MDELQKLTKELNDTLNSEQRSALETLLIDLLADGEWNPRRAAALALDFGSRVALCTLGDCTAAVDALLWLRGRDPRITSHEERVALAKSDPQLRALLSFAVSEAYLEARREVLSASATSSS